MYVPFYLALSYIKVYRTQPEPEFIYLSDARIPPILKRGMVRHDQRRLLLPHDVHDDREDEVAATTTMMTTMTTATTLLDESELQELVKLERSPEETYYKYRGEEILKKSGLSYTIIRVPGFNELATSEASTIDLRASNEVGDRDSHSEDEDDDNGDGKGRNSDIGLVPVSRAEVAQVCVSALLDPSALNKSVYITKKKNQIGRRPVWDEEDISAKFAAIPSDPVS